MKRCVLLLLLTFATGNVAAGERINHEGRILGPAPAVTAPILFNTPEADAVVAAMQVMPRDSAWNEDVSHRPLLANSDAMIAQITSDLASNRRTLRAFFEMNYVLVPDNQPRIAINFFNYPDESDLDGGIDPVGTYPIPTNLPIESWPVGTGALTLAQWQQNVTGDGGDRHSIIVMPGQGKIWETWLTELDTAGWQASNGAKFDLNANTLRPAGWTSGDAAGLPMFPALVRYDECQRGVVEHAVRLVVKHSRLGPIYPATHQASTPATSDPNTPAMGQRIRLKASFVIPADWSIQEKAVLLALKKYGGMVADNGNFFSFSVCPDDRFPSGCFDHLAAIAINNFEVVQSTGPTQGPRSPGAPTANAGPDQVVPLSATVVLPGAVNAPSGNPAILWRKYAGPGTAAIANASALITTATFGVPGTYTLMLSADDGTHAVAYDAAVIQVRLPLAVQATGPDVLVTFPSTVGLRYRVESTGDLANGVWTILADSLPGSGSALTIAQPNAAGLPQQFYRVSIVP